MIRAVIYVPYLPDRKRWLDDCMTYATERRYTVVTVIADWDEACRLINVDRIAEICVCARRDHLPEHRKPRLEVIAEATPAKPRRDDQRRPRRVRRTSATR